MSDLKCGVRCAISLGRLVSRTAADSLSFSLNLVHVVSPGAKISPIVQTFEPSDTSPVGWVNALYSG